MAAKISFQSNLEFTGEGFLVSRLMYLQERLIREDVIEKNLVASIIHENHY